MMGRIEKLCAFLDPCESLADVGCDHGYCTQYALERGLCKSAIISDVSAKSLSKAEKLLNAYIQTGRVVSVCCDGLEGIPRQTEQVIIAGMGGDEIVSILSRAYIPRKFVLQPMRNCAYVRRYLIDAGCAITADDIIEDGKFYFVIKGMSKGGTCSYSAEELEFGRDSLNNPLFGEYAREELAKKRSYLLCCGEGADCASLSRQVKLLEEALKIYECR